MTSELARMLLPIVNNKQVMEALQAYADYRLNLARSGNDSAPNFETVAKNQGAIVELKRFATLRDEVHTKISGASPKQASMTMLQARG